jgi:predicted amidohydrolase YtcJ
MSSPSSDLLLFDGRVLTLNPSRPHADAVLLRDGKILAVGGADEMRLLVTAKTQFLSCRGRTVLPGFIDPHLHLFAWASRFRGIEVNLARSITEIQTVLLEQAVRTPKGKWIRGYGYDEFFLSEKRHPTRQDLDAVSRLHPIVLRHRTGHAAVLNSVALQQAGIDRSFAPPSGGHIERDAATGEPTGVVFECEPFLRTVIPSLTEHDLETGVRQAGAELLRQGVTSFHDASAGNSLADFSLFRRFHADDVLIPRATVMMGIAALPQVVEAGLAPFAGDEWVRLGSMKIMLHESQGALYPDLEELTDMVWRAHRLGFQVAIHAVEESPICLALEAIARAQARLPRQDHRHRIEHCSLCPPVFIENFLETGSVVVTQPGFLYHYGEKYAAEVEADVQPWLYQIRSFLEQGVSVAGSSDCPIAPANPLVGIGAAMTRRSQSGIVIGETEPLALSEAITLFTATGAWVGFEEASKGRIMPGLAADLVILDGDIAQVAPEEICSLQVQTTILDGKIVWTADTR